MVRGMVRWWGGESAQVWGREVVVVRGERGGGGG